MKIDIDCLMNDFVIDQKDKGTLELTLFNVPRAHIRYFSLKDMLVGKFFGNMKVKFAVNTVKCNMGDIFESRKE